MSIAPRCLAEARGANIRVILRAFAGLGERMMLARFFTTKLTHKQIFTALTCCFLSLCVPALAAQLAFGKRALEIPPPDGFVALAQRAPQYIVASQAYLPTSNRLVDSYASSKAADLLAAGTPTNLDRYFQLQTLRKVEGVALSSADFLAARSEIEASFDKALKDVDVQKLATSGNAAVKKQTANDPQIALSDVQSQGVFRREPWGLFFTVKSRVSTAAGSSDLICAGALALINHQLMYLNAYSDYNGPADREWVQRAVSAWADAVHAANPDDPSVAAQVRPFGGFDWSQLRDKALFGAAIGAFVGIVIALVRRRKPR
ncbi:MAG: hypothetical protein ABI846_06120 [Rudaea sp.]